MAPPHRTVHAAIARDQCSESCISSPERLESAWLSHGRAPWLDPLVQEYGSGTVPMGVCVRTQEYLPVAHQARRVASVLSQVTGITLGSIEPRPISRVLKTSRNAALLPSTSLRVTCPANSPRRSGATAVQCSVRTWVRSPARMVLGGRFLAVPTEVGATSRVDTTIRKGTTGSVLCREHHCKVRSACSQRRACVSDRRMADSRPTEAIRRSAKRSAATTGGTPSASARAKTRNVVSKIRSVMTRARSAG